MPAVSWPSEAIFSAWIRLAWAAFSSRYAASAASRAVRISASLRLRSVMSEKISTKPPSGTGLRRISITLPSGMVRS